jgi:cyclase
VSQHQARNMDACEILLAGKDRDGTKDGYDISVTKAIADKSAIFLCWASGRRRGGGASVGGADACLASERDSAAGRVLWVGSRSI